MEEATHQRFTDHNLETHTSDYHRNNILRYLWDTLRRSLQVARPRFRYR